MEKKLALIVPLLLLFGCAKLGGLESIYGAGLSHEARYCLGEAGGSDPKFYECVANLAYAIGNSSLCEEVFSHSEAYAMEEKRNSCLFRVESAGRHVGECMGIDSPSLRDYCIALAGLLPEKCLSIEEGSRPCYLVGESVSKEATGEFSFSCVPLTKSGCLQTIALNSKDVTACSLIPLACDVATNTACRKDYDLCLMQASEMTGDSSLCLNISLQFSGESLGYDSSAKSAECVAKSFGSEARLAYCNSLAGKQRAGCIAQYAASIGQPSLCNLIGEELKGSVSFPLRYDDYARPYNEWSAYVVGKTHDDCLTNIAASKKLPSICSGEFFVEGGNSLCYFEVAISTGDKSLCSMISDPVARASCESSA